MYVGAGPSLVLLDVESDVVVGDAIAMSLNSEDKAWGFNAVVGFEMQNFFIEGQYLWAKAGVEDAPDLDKSQYGGVSVMAGYRF